MKDVTIVVPYYRNRLMLAEQVRLWNQYPEGIGVIVIDDGSPEPAIDVIAEHASAEFSPRLEVFRILKDIPWNRGGARNLGGSLAKTEWIVHIDIDHVLRPTCAERLMKFTPDASTWYRFPRFRNGRADDTRKKDAIDPGDTYGQVKPHIDSFLCTKKLFQANPYDEDYSGCLGGGSPFLQNLERAAPVALMPDDVFLEVWTRDVVADSSDFSLSRDTSEYSRRRKAKEAAGKTKPGSTLRFDWERVH